MMSATSMRLCQASAVEQPLIIFGFVGTLNVPCADAMWRGHM
jgi:hypothetical protein